MYRPLADKIRPRSIDDVAGQEHILGKNGILRRIINSGQIPNMVFYGPSGSGKTTVSNIIAAATNRKLFKLNATIASISEIKEIINELDTMMTPNGVLLYLDEIQYFNKKQQQSLLEFIENGKITLIAATTENPYFYVYNAILSRSTVFEFKPLDAKQIGPVIERAIDIYCGESGKRYTLGDGVVSHIAFSCGGDARKAINAAELLINASVETEDGVIHLTLEDAVSVSQRSSMRYDKEGDVHYDILSAFQKSIRGSDPDAAVFYLARLLEAGDMASACRRMLVTASEDIGLAYPQAVMIVKACIDSALQIGLPEARLPLAQAVLTLAAAPKSNSVLKAIDSAQNDIKNGKAGEVPQHLKDSSYSGAAKLGRGLEYKYPHSFENNYVKQQYLPEENKDSVYYHWGNNKNEQSFKKYWSEIKGGEK